MVFRWLSKKLINIVLVILVLGGGVFGLARFLATRPPMPESEIISKTGIHRHAELTIKILDKYRDIPADIGIGITHLPVHTHKADGVIHMEFSGLVKENDIRLGRFFEIWKKEFNRDCIFDKCNGPEGQIKMLVNSELNSEFEDYIMQDEDNIEIIFEELKKDIKESTGEVKEFDMIAKQWEFSPNTITVNKGDTVILHIESIDVAHGFGFPSGFGGIDAMLEPGEIVDVEFIADERGTFMFACSISCGSGHIRMTGQLIVK